MKGTTSRDWESSRALSVDVFCKSGKTVLAILFGAWGAVAGLVRECADNSRVLRRVFWAAEESVPVFFCRQLENYQKVDKTWTVSRTERNVVFPLKLSTIDLDGGLCDGFMRSDGVGRGGLSSDSNEFECIPCMVGVLES